MVVRSVSFLILKSVVPTTLLLLFSMNVCAAQSEEALELRVRGYHAQERGSIDEAIELYKRAAAADPAYATPHNDLGILYEDQGKLIDAEREYRTALDLDPQYGAVYTNLASLYDRQGRPADSLPLWKKRAELGESGDRWRRQAEERVAELEASDVQPVPESAGGEEMDMAQGIADLIVQEQQAKSGGQDAALPVGYTTVRFAPPPGTGALEDWYGRTPEAASDLGHEEVEVASLGPEAHAKILMTRARVAMKMHDYQRAVGLLSRARELDPDEVGIEKLYKEARDKQIEEDIVRASIDSSVYNRRKIMEVEEKWFPPKPEDVEPFDKSKYIVKGSEKSEQRLELERRAKQTVPTIDFTDAKLKNVIEYLAVSNDINIVVDEAAVPADERVTVHLKNIPLDEALDIILRTKGLKFRLEENIIWITSIERLLEEDLEVRVYDVQDLVGKLYDFPSEPFDFEKFVQPGKTKKTAP